MVGWYPKDDSTTEALTTEITPGNAAGRSNLLATPAPMSHDQTYPNEYYFPKRKEVTDLTFAELFEKYQWWLIIGVLLILFCLFKSFKAYVMKKRRHNHKKSIIRRQISLRDFPEPPPVVIEPLTVENRALLISRANTPIQAGSSPAISRKMEPQLGVVNPGLAVTPKSRTISASKSPVLEPKMLMDCYESTIPRKWSSTNSPGPVAPATPSIQLNGRVCEEVEVQEDLIEADVFSYPTPTAPPQEKIYIA